MMKWLWFILIIRFVMFYNLKKKLKYPILYLIHTSDAHTHPSTIHYTFADDTALLSLHTVPAIASLNLQHLNSLEDWFGWSRIHPKKSSSFNFTPWRSPYLVASLNQTLIPPSDTVRYLGVHLNQKLITDGSECCGDFSASTPSSHWLTNV